MQCIDHRSEPDRPLLPGVTWLRGRLDSHRAVGAHVAASHVVRRVSTERQRLARWQPPPPPRRRHHQPHEQQQQRRRLGAQATAAVAASRRPAATATQKGAQGQPEALGRAPHARPQELARGLEAQLGGRHHEPTAPGASAAPRGLPQGGGGRAGQQPQAHRVRPRH